MTLVFSTLGVWALKEKGREGEENKEKLHSDATAEGTLPHGESAFTKVLFLCSILKQIFCLVCQGSYYFVQVDELKHPEGSQSRTAAPSHKQKLDVWASV